MWLDNVHLSAQALILSYSDSNMEKDSMKLLRVKEVVKKQV